MPWCSLRNVDYDCGYSHIKKMNPINSTNFLRGMGQADSGRGQAHRLVGFRKLRESVDAADADADSAGDIIDLSKEPTGRDCSVILLLKRTAGSGNLQATLKAWYPDADEAQGGPKNDLPFAATVGDASGGDEDQIRFDNLLAAKYRVYVTDAASSTWDIYVAHSSNPYS